MSLSRAHFFVWRGVAIFNIQKQIFYMELKEWKEISKKILLLYYVIKVYG